MDITNWSTYGAKMLDFSVGEISVSNNYFFAPKGFFPVRYAGSHGMRDVSITLEFTGTWATCTQNASNLVKDLSAGSDILLPDGFWYYCVLLPGKAPKRKGFSYESQVFTLKGVRHAALVTSTLSSDGTVSNTGNRETPVRLTISNVTEDIEVMGVTISDFTGTIVIDGINGTVTAGGNNAFMYTDFTEFPKLQPGSNSITVPSGVSLTIEFYPLWW